MEHCRSQLLRRWHKGTRRKDDWKKHRSESCWERGRRKREVESFKRMLADRKRSWVKVRQAQSWTEVCFQALYLYWGQHRCSQIKYLSWSVTSGRLTVYMLPGKICHAIINSEELTLIKKNILEWRPKKQHRDKNSYLAKEENCWVSSQIASPWCVLLLTSLH